MTDQKNEYNKFVDSAVMARAREAGFGRLRLGVFWGVAGPLAMFGMHMAKFETPRWLAMALVATAPLAIVLLIINYIRLPNEHKGSPQALMICLITIVGAMANIALATHFGIFKTITP